MSEQSDEILTIDEVAAYLKAGKRTVYRLAASGKLSRIGKDAVDDERVE